MPAAMFMDDSLEMGHFFENSANFEEKKGIFSKNGANFKNAKLKI